MPLQEPVPDLTSLDLLRSVARLGSITRAAAAHEVTQPAASMRLRGLERTLGVTLLDRTSAGARLTPAGAAVVEWAEPVLDGVRSLQAGASALRADRRTQLRLMASMTVAEYLMPGWLARLRVADPQVAVSLQMGNSHQVVDVIRRGEADIGFVETRLPPAGLGWRTVGADDLVVVVPPTHPWARRGRRLTADELSATPIVAREPGSGTREVLEMALADRDLPLSVLVELGSTQAIKAAVAAGAGPATLSRLAVRAEIDDGRLVALPVEGLDLERSIRAVWAPGGVLAPPARRLLAEIAGVSGSVPTGAGAREPAG